MYKLQVKADKLNIRNTPEADPKFANWVGDMDKGAIFTAVRIVKGVSYDGSDDWYADDGGSGSRFIAASQVEDVSAYQDWMIDLKMPEIWKKVTGKGVGVAVIDTGININNTELLFDKDNYYVFDKKISLEDTNGHGTHCAGLIGAKNHNNSIIGAAPNCNLYVCKISEKGSLDEPETTRYSDAINWCTNQENIHVISISWASIIGDEAITTEIQKSIDNAVKNNKIVVCAMGDASQLNDPGPLYPAALNNTIGVGSIPIENILYPYINKSLTTITRGYKIASLGLSNQLVEMTGTSQSNAIVAGLIALIIEKKKFNYTPSEIKNILLSLSSLHTFGENKIPVIDGTLLLQYF